jgi:hypothetical protein
MQPKAEEQKNRVRYLTIGGILFKIENGFQIVFKRKDRFTESGYIFLLPAGRGGIS